MDQRLAPPPWLGRLPEWARRPAVVLGAGLAAVVVVVVAFVFLRPPAGPKPALVLPKAGAGTASLPAEGASGSAPSVSPVAGSSPSSTASVATVHAAGAVASPGVYGVPMGARVSDVVVAAGGPVPEADLDRLNLAAKVADGDRVYVPRKGEAMPPADGGGGATDAVGGGAGTGGAGGGGSGTGSLGGAAGGAGTATGPIDLNTATAEQLDTLPGIGPATAQAIVTYRTRHGRFRSVTELLEVPGIGPAKLESVRPLVKV